MSQPSPSAFTAETTREPSREQVPSRHTVLIGGACLTSVMTAVHYTNYAPLIPILQADLHISSGQAGLMSTLLFLGLAVAYIPGGALIDRYGQRPILIGSCTLMVSGGVLLPLIPNITWILLCRFITGIGAGGAFVAGAGVAASMGKYASLAQGLYGGSVQIGSGLALLVTPLLYHWLNWRGTFLFWGLLGISAVIPWLLANQDRQAHTAARVDIKAGLRSSSVWPLSLSHLGTFRLGNAIAAWIAVHPVHQYGLTLCLPSTLHSIALLSRMFFRRLGRILLSRTVIASIPLLRVG